MLVGLVIGAGGLVLNIVRVDLYEVRGVLRQPVHPRLVKQMRPRAPSGISHQPNLLMQSDGLALPDEYLIEV
jgi:hypothetical protein